MPPQRNTDKIQKEGHLLLARQAYESGKISSIKQAVLLSNVPRKMLLDRVHGRVARVDMRANGLKLTTNKEDYLVQ
jgi:hypothetical protein